MLKSYEISLQFKLLLSLRNVSRTFENAHSFIQFLIAESLFRLKLQRLVMLVKILNANIFTHREVILLIYF